MLNTTIGAYRASVLSTVLLTTLSLTVTATEVEKEEARSEKFISDAVGPGDSDSKWVLGAYTGSITSPYEGEGVKGFLIPSIEYRGEYFFVSDGNVGFNLFRHQGLSTGVFLTVDGSLLADEEDYEDNDLLDGLEERDATLNAGIYLKHTTPLGQLRVAVHDEVTGEHDGQSAIVDYTFDFKYKNVNINPVVGLAWNSADTVNHDFGISTKEATNDRKEYKGTSSVSVYTGVRARYDITEHWDVDVGVGVVKLGSGIKDSSIVEKDTLFISAVGVNYNF